MLHALEQEFDTLMQLGNRSDVTLIQYKQSGQLYVRRMVNAEQATVYQKLRNIKSPYLPEIIQVLCVTDDKYEVIEAYIQGKTLEDTLKECTTLTEPVAALHLTQLCEAMESIHGAGIIHRDIKPSNIIISSDQKLHLIDFDIARLYKAEQSEDTALLGTQGYAAPEQFGFQQTDVRTDIYAAGVLLNKMLTGTLPQEQLPASRIKRIILRCIDIDPMRRYQKASKLKRALRAYVPMRYAPIVHMVRQLPGFRTWTPWKMCIAAPLYTIWLACFFYGCVNFPSLPLNVTVSILSSYAFYALLFFYCFDCFGLRSRIKWLQKVRGRPTYILRSIVFGFISALTILIVMGILLTLIH